MADKGLNLFDECASKCVLVSLQNEERTSLECQIKKKKKGAIVKIRIVVE